jgi:hypothetical protein
VAGTNHQEAERGGCNVDINRRTTVERTLPKIIKTGPRDVTPRLFVYVTEEIILERGE